MRHEHRRLLPRPGHALRLRPHAGKPRLRRRGQRFTKRGFKGNINVTRSSRGDYFVGFINDNPQFLKGPRDFADLSQVLTGSTYTEAWARLEGLLEEEESVGPSADDGQVTLKGFRTSSAIRRLAQKMSRRGFPLDRDKLHTAQVQLHAEKESLERALANDLRIGRARLSSVGARRRALKRLPQERQRLDAVLARDGYLARLAATSGAAGYVDVAWNPGAAMTGRWGASPHVMSAPKDLRSVFKPPEGKVVVVGDLGAADVVGAGVLSGERHLARAAFHDVYLEVARRLFGARQASAQRSTAKLVTLQSLYGAGTESLQAALAGVTTTFTAEQVAELRDQWVDVHRSFADWRKKLYRRARQTGRLVINSGRVIHFAPYVLRHEGQAAAWCIQGTITALFDQMLLSLERRLAALDGSAVIVGMVHDSVIVVCDAGEVKRVARLVHKSLRSASTAGRSFKFRVDVKAGPSWGELAEVKS